MFTVAFGSVYKKKPLLILLRAAFKGLFRGLHVGSLPLGNFWRGSIWMGLPGKFGFRIPLTVGVGPVRVIRITPGKEDYVNPSW
uniref:Uncharacterized protein n=1 Tax=Picea glauca TaxID=3330 RepID=A0A101LWW0_PICGL|nr:hypothetical protein ABT39_MTgene6296 [Picea glauca]QHR88001.1 hypothetical protein Q903MT_gene2013 [Picea sitchensis]